MNIDSNISSILNKYTSTQNSINYKETSVENKAENKQEQQTVKVEVQHVAILQEQKPIEKPRENEDVVYAKMAETDTKTERHRVVETALREEAARNAQASRAGEMEAQKQSQKETSLHAYQEVANRTISAKEGGVVGQAWNA
ncbi:MAG: hypothetical protein PHV30_01415 [Candidatus Margulisbacteria bacterium]|nr:hypothetical protein [Candidatus Margulisiibacteriota bacterium]